MHEAMDTSTYMYMYHVAYLCVGVSTSYFFPNIFFHELIYRC